MSFEDMKKADLVAVATEFAVESTGTKAQIIENLEADGVTFELYQGLLNAVNPEAATAEEPDVAPVVAANPAPEPVDTGDKVLIKFEGSGSYAGPGVKFSAKNPFALVPPATADRLISKNSKLFREANSREAEAFYN